MPLVQRTVHSMDSLDFSVCCALQHNNIVKFAAFLDSGDMKTFTAKTGEINHGWFVVDAHGKVLGRLAPQIAARLPGQHKAEYTPHADTRHVVLGGNTPHPPVTLRLARRQVFHPTRPAPT